MKESAVIVPVLFIEKEPYLLFIRRSRSLFSHPGQVSFPGGRLDEGETELQAALREMEEEIGVTPSRVIVLSRLESASTATSDYTIKPYLAVIDNLHFNLSRDEVEDLIFVSLRAFDEAPFDYIKLPSGYETPRYRFPGLVIWGATAKILENSLETIEHIMNQS